MKMIRTCLLALVLISGACSKSDDKPRAKRDLKYEITGSYTGSVTAVYTNANGSTVSETVHSLPWKKELTVASTIAGVGFSFSPVAGKPGVTGQTMTLRLSAGGQVKESVDGVADAMGYMVTFASIAYIIR